MATSSKAAETKQPQEPVGAADETPEPTPAVKRKLTQLEAGDKVAYVVNRAYVAGEAPDITEASVTKIHDKKTGVVDLQVEGDEEKKTSVRYSERHEPHTWHFAPRE